MLVNSFVRIGVLLISFLLLIVFSNWSDEIVLLVCCTWNLRFLVIRDYGAKIFERKKKAEKVIYDARWNRVFDG